MSMFGLDESEIAQLVRAVAGEELDRDAIQERFARATWSSLVEPGDRLAGALIAALGAPAALALVVQRVTGVQLAQQCLGSVSAEEATQALDRWMPRLRSNSPLIALRQAARFGARLRVPGEEGWPEGFAGLDLHAPLALWTRGTERAYHALSQSIALVGARAATGYGEHVTMEASAGLVDRGYAIVSGAAYGIDGMAHRAALASHGQTIAFLAGGADRFYPSGHHALLGRIVEQGVVISELPCGSTPTRWRFLQRNRLIAASSLATVVLEAGWRSGSLNTAHHALELCRPLGAVPGPVTSAASAGCHRLIRQSQASCVTTAEEMAELAPLPGAAPTSPMLDREPPENTRLLDALSTRSARSVEQIAALAGLSLADVRRQLGELELAGAARDDGLGWTKRGLRR